MQALSYWSILLKRYTRLITTISYIQTIQTARFLCDIWCYPFSPIKIFNSPVFNYDKLCNSRNTLHVGTNSIKVKNMQLGKQFRLICVAVFNNQQNKTNIIIVTMKRKIEPNMNIKANVTGHWSTGLLKSMEDSECKVKEDDKIIIIKDKYPKAQFHYLVLPKEDIPSIWHVKASHHDLLIHMHNVAHGLVEKQADHEFIMGYHAMPSMQRLHLHVISTDFNSPCLKTKHHWNSFTTPFFLPSQDICRELREVGELKKVSPEICKDYLNTKIKCHKCSAKLKHMPHLKRHLLTHLKTLVK